MENTYTITTESGAICAGVGVITDTANTHMEIPKWHSLISSYVPPEIGGNGSHDADGR